MYSKLLSAIERALIDSAMDNTPRYVWEYTGEFHVTRLEPSMKNVIVWAIIGRGAGE